MKCRLCERHSEGELCRYHREAKVRLESAYGYWNEAYGSLTWKEYLGRVSKNGETGQWAAEVAKMMLSEE